MKKIFLMFLIFIPVSYCLADDTYIISAEQTFLNIKTKIMIDHKEVSDMYMNIIKKTIESSTNCSCFIPYEIKDEHFEYHYGFYFPLSNDNYYIQHRKKLNVYKIGDEVFSSEYIEDYVSISPIPYSEEKTNNTNEISKLAELFKPRVIDVLFELENEKGYSVKLYKTGMTINWCN